MRLRLCSKLKFYKKSNIQFHPVFYIIIYIVLILLAILTTSCATTVDLKVTRPAEVDFDGAESIAILPFGTEGSARIENRNGKRLPVIDFFMDLANKESEQQEIVSFMHDTLEEKLSKSTYIKLIDDKAVLSALQNGNESPADIYLAGKITSYNTRIHKSKRKEKEGEKTVIHYYYKRSVSMCFEYHIYDGKNSRVLYTNKFWISYDSSEMDEEWKLPSATNIICKYVKNDLNDIVHKIQPYDVSKTIYLLKAKKNPEIKLANEYVKNGDIEVGLEMFLHIYNRDSLFEAGYNAAALLESQGKFEEAKNLAQKVADKEYNKKIAALLNDIEYEIKMDKKLKIQLDNKSGNIID